MKLKTLLKKDTNFAAEKIFQLIWHKKPVDIQNENSENKEILPILSCCLFFVKIIYFFPESVENN